MWTALIAISGLGGMSGLIGKRLTSAWGVLVPCAAIGGLTALEPDFSQWRIVVVSALLSTVAMLFHHRLRHYLLLPSCLALVSGLVAVSVNFWPI